MTAIEEESLTLITQLESEAEATLTAFSEQCVLVIGDVMLDENLYGEVRRISPEAPVPVLDLRRHTMVPGGAANNAVNVVGLGATVRLGGVIGDDLEGQHLRAALADRGIPVDGLVTEVGRPTTTKTRIVAHNQQLVRVDREVRGPIDRETQECLLTWVARTLPEVDVCILADYAKGVVTPHVAREVIRLARSADCPVVVDPKGRDFARYRGAMIITPNLSEAEQATGREVQEERDLLALGTALVERLGGAVLVTRGADGMSLFQPGSAPVHRPTQARQIFDVTGAGDTVITTLALAVAAGAPLPLAMDLANAAASVVVGKVGTVAVAYEELKAALISAPMLRT